MNIAIDFDQCYTEDATLWDMFVSSAQQRGHTIYIVSARYQDGEEIPWAPVPDKRVIYTNRKAKRPHLEMTLGIHIDIWIDDRPEFINADHGDLLKWTQEDQATEIANNPKYKALYDRRIK